jgi:hypothetical protein
MKFFTELSSLIGIRADEPGMDTLKLTFQYNMTVLTSSAAQIFLGNNSIHDSRRVA